MGLNRIYFFASQKELILSTVYSSSIPLPHVKVHDHSGLLVISKYQGLFNLTLFRVNKLPLSPLSS